MTTARQDVRDAAGIAVLILAWLACTAWARPLMLPDEGRYAGVAWEMLRSGDWLTPTLNGLPFFHKPPLFYWLAALALQATGDAAWAGRAPSLLGAAAVALALYLFARRWSGIAVARAALLVLLTQPLFFGGAQFANLDMLVAGCIGVTVLLLAHAVLSAEGDERNTGALVAAYLFAALGVLAKGLIGALLPALAILGWLVFTRRWRHIGRLVSLPGLIVFVAVAVPWFVAMQQRHPEFGHYFFVVQHFQRFAEGGFNNVQPFWFYPVALAVLGLPWTLWLAGAFGDRGDPAGRDLRVLMTVWAAAVIGFFSLPSSKLIGYVLPALPPLAFLIADGGLRLLRDRPGRRRLWQLSAGSAAIVCLGAVVALSLHTPKSAQLAALALRAQRHAGEPVVFLERYAYDLPLYAGLSTPVTVIDDWAASRAERRDDWRAELTDAARFASASGTQLLQPPAALAPLLCRAGLAWVVSDPKAAERHPFLAAAERIPADRDTALWKIDTRLAPLFKALDCAQMPNADSKNM